LRLRRGYLPFVKSSGLVYRSISPDFTTARSFHGVQS
jgi:hypothetical protein